MSRRRANEVFGPRGTPSIAIVGAGFAGIGLGVLLKKAGIHTFTIYEKADRVGGTWWYNDYPGAEVDTVSCVYSFPFHQRVWTRTHAKQPELHAYLEETVERFGLGPHLHLGVGVESAVWEEETHRYTLALDTGERTECHVLVGATGFLNIPRYPSWPGLEEFAGPKFHTSRWEHEHDPKGRRVAIVGTGSTATQIVPELADDVEKLYVFQREPGWIVPKGERDYTPEERARLANPWRYRIERLKQLWIMEKAQWRAAAFRPGTHENDRGRRAALAFIERELDDRPDLRDAVTPDYPFWGKRLIQNTTFYRALKHPNVELVPRAVASVTSDGLVDVDGVERKVDVLVMATGFQTSNYLGTVEIRGRGGRSLQEHWAGEPHAFLGITVPEFPNFFIMYGPGTNGGEIVSMLMHQAKYIVRAAKRMQRRGLTALEVKRTWARMYNAWLQSKIEATAWALADNYYKGATGTVVTQWPYGPAVYGVLVRVLGRASEAVRVRDVHPPEEADHRAGVFDRRRHGRGESRTDE